MKNLILPGKSGMDFDLWLKKKRDQSTPLLQFSVKGKIVYAIKKAAEYYQYFTWTHYSDECGTWRYFHVSACNQIALEYNPSATLTTAALSQYRTTWGKS